jgi:hypothetical protein
MVEECGQQHSSGCGSLQVGRLTALENHQVTHYYYNGMIFYLADLRTALMGEIDPPGTNEFSEIGWLINDELLAILDYPDPLTFHK